MGSAALASLTISTSRLTSSLSHPLGGIGRFLGGIPLIHVRLSKRHAPIFPGVNVPCSS